MWPNTFQMRKCMQSEKCITKSLAEQEDNSSAARPPYKFDFAAAKPGPIGPMEWAKHGIDGAHHSAGGLGSLGVFLLNLKGDGGVIVMKQGSIESAAEYFCSHLYAALGIPVAQMRVMEETELAKVVKELAGVCFTVPGAGDALQSGGKQRGAVLMDYCRGKTFKDPTVATMLDDAKVGPQLMHQLGRLVGADMLVNNFDRTPAIWDHEGNANNVLVDVDRDGAVVVMGIDQSTTKIVEDFDSTRVEDYAAKVQAAFGEAVNSDTSGKYTAKVRAFLKKYVGTDVDGAGWAAYHKGLIEAGLAIAAYHEFAVTFDKASVAFHDAGWGVPGLESINIPFLERVAEAIAVAVSKA